MTITLNIKPEVEAALSRQAADAGRALEVYAAALLEEAAHSATPAQVGTGQALIDACAKVRGFLTDEEIDAFFSRNPSVSRSVDFE